MRDFQKKGLTALIVLTVIAAFSVFFACENTPAPVQDSPLKTVVFDNVQTPVGGVQFLQAGLFSSGDEDGEGGVLNVWSILSVVLTFCATIFGSKWVKWKGTASSLAGKISGYGEGIEIGTALIKKVVEMSEDGFSDAEKAELAKDWALILTKFAKPKDEDEITGV